MDFDAVLEQVLALVQKQERVSYRAIKRRFDIEDDLLEDLKEEILFAHPHIVDEAGRGFVWTDSQTVSIAPSDSDKGSALSAAEPPVRVPTAEAERRQLTVMFCDLVGSTQLSAQLDPEAYREVVRAYQTAYAEVIERFDGYIAQYLGDGLLVYFGYPQAHEDDAARAVRAALNCLTVLEPLNARLAQDHDLQVSVRIGIHTGPVVVGEIGAGARQERLAMGETPNIAARIQGLAAPDTVVMSEATAELVRGYFESESLGAQTLRGVPESMIVYRVWRGSGAQNRLDIAPTLTPLVGREQELRLLVERWEQAKTGQGQVVLLSGEAGIGKSRLVQALKDYVAEGRHAQLACRSLPYYQNTALYPMIELVERGAGFHRDDPPWVKLDKLEHALSQYHRPLEETAPLFAALFSLPAPESHYPSLNLSPQQQRQKTLEAMVGLLLELAERQPLLFIVEDLQWTDPTTLELLALLIIQVPTSSLLILLTCRPEFHLPWGQQSYLTIMSLSRLINTQAIQIVEQLADGLSLPEEVLQQILDKTDGVPLFIEEMTKAVLESGVLQVQGGEYELVGSLEALAIPNTLQDSLMARLDRLMTAKVIAQLGATIGRQFSYELLRAVSQLDDATLQRELGRLVEAELVYQHGVPPQATYIFKHALVQDTAYESLLRRTQQQYHQQIAKILEAQFHHVVEAQPEAVARHYTEAGMKEQAIDYWYQAGQRAKARSAHVEAISHLRKGLTLLETLPGNSERYQRELVSQVMLGSSFLATKGQGSADMARAYTRARELCQQMGDTPQLFDVLCGLHLFYVQQAEFQTSLEIGQQLLALAQRRDNPAFHVGAQAALGMSRFFLLDLAAARRELERGMAFYNSHQFPALTCRYGESDTGILCHIYASATLWMLGYPDQAQRRHLEALTLARELAHPYSLVLALGWSALLYQYRRDVSSVHEQAEAVIALANQHGFASWLPQGTYLQGWALALKGHGQEGIAQIHQGLDAKRAAGSKRHEDRIWGLLAEAYGQTDRLEKGLDAIAEGLAVVGQYRERTYEAELYRLKGQLVLQQSADNTSEAEESFQQALDVARHQQAKSLELRAATSLAHLWQSQGKLSEAHGLLAPVYDWFTEGFDTADLQEAKSLLATLSA